MARISPFLKSAIKRGKIALAPNQGTVESLHRRQLVEWHIYSRNAAGVRNANYTVVEATVERMSRRAADGNAMDATAMASVSRPQKSAWAASKAATARVMAEKKPVAKTATAKLPKPPKPTKPAGKVAGKTAGKVAKVKPTVAAPATLPPKMPQSSSLFDATTARVIFLVDRSPSMLWPTSAATSPTMVGLTYSQAEAALASPAGKRFTAVNAQISAILAALKKDSPHYLVDLIDFDRETHDCYRALRADSNQATAGTQTLGTSGTAIFVALDHAVSRALAYIATNPVLIYMLTDGENNGPVMTGLDDKIKLLLNSNRATIAAIGPQATLSFLTRLNVPAGCIRDWNGSDAVDLHKATQQAVAGVQQFQAAVKSGKSAIDTFFIDAVKQGITVAAAKSQLRDITSSLRRRKISKFVKMETFVKTELKREYVPGAGYYQVYKAETLKQGRRIILQPRGEDIFLAGPAARKLLGLPEDRDVRVEPKNLGDFIIYFQSASPNRKLPPDTTLLYDESHVAGATVPTWSVMGGASGTGGTGASGVASTKK